MRSILSILLSLLLCSVAESGLFDGLITKVANRSQSRWNTLQDLKRTPKELIESRGLIAKFYKATTSDGYVNTLFRIVNPHYKGQVKGPLLLQHGLNGNALHWMENTPGKVYENNSYMEDNGIITDCKGKNVRAVGNTLAFVLSACGYDVWLGNNRGTKFSYEHVQYDSAKDKDYWRYSIDELELDQIANIALIMNETKAETIGYIGHSLGTAQMFQLLAEYPEYNKIIKPYIALAPVAYLGFVQGLLKLALRFEPIINLVDGPAYLVPPETLGMVDTVISNVCETPIIDRLCETFFFLVSGVNYNENDVEKFGARVAPDGTSMRVFAQLAHRANFGNLAKYDHGLLNYKYYGQLTPPEYNLKNITNKNMIFISATNDLLADVKDVQRMRNLIQEQLLFDYVVPDIKYQHGDVIWANNVGRLVNWVILDMLKQFFE